MKYLMVLTVVLGCSASQGPEKRHTPDASDPAGADFDGGDSVSTDDDNPPADDDNPSDNDVETLVGRLVGGSGPYPGAIAGIAFSSAGGVAGRTDAQGHFNYSADATVQFRIANILLPPVEGQTWLSPYAFFSGGACHQSPELVKLLVLLYSLDADGNLGNGVALPEFAASSEPARTLASMSLAEIATRVGHLIPGRTLVSESHAIDVFVRAMDAETWEERSIDTFSGATALRRGQGVATDGTSWFFSGTLSLDRTDASFNTQQKNDVAIPVELLFAKSDHIGDIDVWNGLLYAPIEDGNGDYQNPKVVTYNAQSLSAEDTYDIPRERQTQGVPWVAVDGERELLYLAEWDPTTAINVFALSNVQYQRSIPIVLPPGQASLGRIQGAKVFEGSLYLASDESVRTIYKVNLETGTTIVVLSLSIDSEQQGLAFWQRDDGTVMHTLNITGDRTGSELRHHERTQEPLRALVCVDN